MNKTLWIVLIVTAACAGFVVGKMLPKGGKTEVVSGKRAVEARGEDGESHRLGEPLDAIEKLRKELTEKEREIRRLEAQLAQVEVEAVGSPDADELERYREWVERQKESERREALYEKARAFRKKVKDDESREEALAELTALVASDKPDDKLLGLMGLFHLDGLQFDKEKFKPQVLAALQHEQGDVRHAALNCLSMVAPDEEAFNIVVGMSGDNSPDVRASAAFHLGFIAKEWGVAGEPNPESPSEDPMETQLRGQVEEVLTSLLGDEDESVRRRAFVAMTEMCERHGGPEKAEKVNEWVTRLSTDSERADDILRWWERRTDISAEDAHRFFQILIEGDFAFMGSKGYGERGLGVLLPSVSFLEPMDPAPPLVSQLCFRLLREGTDDGLRLRALDVVRESRDASALSQLEEIAQSERSESVRKKLEKTIEDLRRKKEVPLEEPTQEEVTEGE